MNLGPLTSKKIPIGGAREATRADAARNRALAEAWPPDLVIRSAHIVGFHHVAAVLTATSSTVPHLDTIRPNIAAWTAEVNQGFMFNRPVDWRLGCCRTLLEYGWLG
jgi:hypothetical protein